MPRRPKNVPTRRLPDTYNFEATDYIARRGGRGVVSATQFFFIEGVEDLRPTGDPKTPRRLNELKYMVDTGNLLEGGNYKGKIRAERYRG